MKKKSKVDFPEFKWKRYWVGIKLPDGRSLERDYFSGCYRIKGEVNG